MTTTSKQLVGKVEFHLEPVVCPRPRVSKYGAYYPPKYKKFREDMDGLIKAACLPSCVKGPVVVTLEFVCSSPKNPANPYPVGDIDNYIKAILDNIQGKAFFADDKQVTKCLATKRYTRAGEEAHIKIEVNHAN